MPAGKPQFGMVKNHAQDRDGSQTVYVWSVIIHLKLFKKF
jgi:hypothetical protein